MKKIAITKRKVIVGTMIGLAIAVCALFYITFKVNQQAEPVVEIVPVQDVSAKLDRYALDGQVDEGMDFIDAQIEGHENQEDKQSLLVYKSQFATQVGRTDIALDSANQANGIAPTIASNLALAEGYEKNGDKQQAVVYYQKVVDSIEDNTFMSRYKQQWEDKIKELSS